MANRGFEPAFLAFWNCDALGDGATRAPLGCFELLSKERKKEIWKNDILLVWFENFLLSILVSDLIEQYTM